LIVGVTERVHAQQTGLFPLAPIRRQRVPCDQQDPTYKIHKYQYFGYFPTCWRRFPEGWGCPSPEAPDKAEAFRKQKFDAGIEFNQPGRETGPGMETQPELNRPAVPRLPGGAPSPFQTSPFQTSPFNLDQRTPAPGAAPGATPRTAPNVPRGTDTPVPPNFDLERKDPVPPAGGNPPRAGQNSSAAPPELFAPTADADQTRENRNNSASFDREINPDEDGPVLALPNIITVPPVDDSPMSVGAQEPQTATAIADAGSNPVAAANSSAPRRGFLSGLLNNLGLNWTRR
jgi:hypothetical protein